MKAVIGFIVGASLMSMVRASGNNPPYFIPEERSANRKLCEDSEVEDTCVIAMPAGLTVNPLTYSVGGRAIEGGKKHQAPAPHKGYVFYKLTVRFTVVAKNNLEKILCRARLDSGQDVEVFQQKIFLDGNLQEPNITGPTSVTPNSSFSWSCSVDGGSLSYPKVVWKFANGTVVNKNFYSQTIDKAIGPYLIDRIYVTSIVNLTLQCNDHLTLQCYAVSKKCTDKSTFFRHKNHEIIPNCPHRTSKATQKTESKPGAKEEEVNVGPQAGAKSETKGSGILNMTEKTILVGEKALELDSDSKSSGSPAAFAILSSVIGAVLFVLAAALVATYYKRRNEEKRVEARAPAVNASNRRGNIPPLAQTETADCQDSSSASWTSTTLHVAPKCTKLA